MGRICRVQSSLKKRIRGRIQVNDIISSCCPWSFFIEDQSPRCCVLPFKTIHSSKGAGTIRRLEIYFGQTHASA
jgi:hypothetical protein